MIIFSQSIGRLWAGTELIGPAYAGYPPDVNNPADQAIKEFGPLPRNLYSIGALEAEHPELGANVMKLTPIGTGNMFNRGGFYIHGKNALHPNASSKGCIVADLPYRLLINQQTDRVLMVIY